MDFSVYLWSIPALIIAIVGHEIGHGYVSYLLGDDTAKRDGRLSINPLDHIDPVGLLFMIVFRFGWAKAVPINPRYYKNRKRGTIIVSLAGVTVNFIFALIAGTILSSANFSINSFGITPCSAYLISFRYRLSTALKCSHPCFPAIWNINFTAMKNIFIGSYL